MIIENTSKHKTTFFYMCRDGDMSNGAEVVTIMPESFVYIDESKWNLNNLKAAMDSLKELDTNNDLVIKGDRKNYPIGYEHPKREEFIDRTDLIDLDE